MWEMLKETRQKQELFDRQIAAWTTDYCRRGGTISCGKGCCGCCSLAVNCTFTEALRVADSLDERLAERVRLHAPRLLERMQGVTDLKEFLKIHRNEIGPCPFLDEDGSCGVYEVRPFTCRALLATRESRWCSADFSKISSEEKQAFVESLDREVVSFPMHYAALPQELGRELESMTARRTADCFGVSLYGTLPFLVYLQLEHGLADIVAKGYEAVAAFLHSREFAHPFLVSCDR